MIKLDSSKFDGTAFQVGLLSDTKEEVIAMGNKSKDIQGMLDGCDLAMGSTCFTTNQELGILNSVGQWKF